MRMGLFVPCHIDAFFPEVGIATLELLERFGHEVVYPRDRTCCGRPTAGAQGVRSLSVLPVAPVTGRSTQPLETTP